MKTVDRGAALLDDIEPDWFEHVDLEELDLGSPCNCVLGQLYRFEHPRLRKLEDAFGRKADELGLEDGELARFGFVKRTYQHRYANLTAAWRRLIEQRRARAG